MGGSVTAEITPAAQAFIRQHIKAVWQLELLLYLKKCEKALTIVEVSRALQLEPRAVEDCLRDFAEQNILHVDHEHRYKYLPKATLSKAIDETAKSYNERRISVINFIYAQPIGNLPEV
ncbi:MAG: hypothetical protein JST44_25305 [Cyanobacteria bacterium SZAS LIN-5]|nr:hypothetical protein [Cyanobacteria bacterium SZAS LIN-5]RTL36681.1 MAG: hypothetical protein EKK48_25960 [Candidatus Melainabacteria bacterium]